MFHLLQAFPVVDLLGFMDGLPKGYRPAVLGYLFEPGSPAVSEHEVRLGDPQLLEFLPRFHRFQKIIHQHRCKIRVNRTTEFS